MDGDLDDEKEKQTFFFTLVGQYGAGKSSMINKLRKNHFIKTYKPTEKPKTLKYKLQHKSVNELEDNAIFLSICDYPGCTATTIDEKYLNKKSHIVILMYSYEDPETFDTICAFLENEEIFDGRVIMVVRTKVDSKKIATSMAVEENEEREHILRMNDEILFIPRFSAKSKSNIVIEKMFVKAINAYRDRYGDKPPKGMKKVKKKSSVGNVNKKKSVGKRKNSSKKKKNVGGGRVDYDEEKENKGREDNGNGNQNSCCIIL